MTEAIIVESLVFWTAFWKQHYDTPFVVLNDYFFNCMLIKKKLLDSTLRESFCSTPGGGINFG